AHRAVLRPETFLAAVRTVPAGAGRGTGGAARQVFARGHEKGRLATAPAIQRDRTGDQVFMMCRPAARLAMRPLPPRALAARFLAAVMRPPLLFFAIIRSSVAAIDTQLCAATVEDSI